MVAASEFLGPDHGHEQVNEQQQGHKPHNQVFHRFSLHSLAESDIQPANHEEQHDNSDIDEIHHKFSLEFQRSSFPGAQTANAAKYTNNCDQSCPFIALNMRQHRELG